MCRGFFLPTLCSNEISYTTTMRYQEKNSVVRKAMEIIMNQGFRKYTPFKPINIKDRTWPDNQITKAPIWCSVDMRDGNQSIVDPMNLQEKLEFFQTLLDVGFKEIEVGFPSASDTDYEILRTLIEGGYIPDDVTLLPNTSGARNAEEAVRIARMSRELGCGGSQHLHPQQL